MKAISCLLFLLLVCSSAAQPDTCRAMDSTAVVRMEGASAEELYARARRWFAVAYKDGAVVHTTDTTGHMVIGRTMAPYPGGGWIHCTVEIGCREGRYRYRVHSLHHTDPQPSMQVTDMGEVEEHRNLGRIYDCDICCDLHRYWRGTHARQHATRIHYTEECRTKILIHSHSALATIVSSLRTGMEMLVTTKEDW